MGKLWSIVKVIFITVITAWILEYCFRDLILQHRDIELNVANKRVLVTGASTGIGEQIAYRYAELGAKLVITSRRRRVLEKVAEKCRHLGSPSVSVFAADMGDPKQVDGVSEHALRHFDGRIDHVILNHVGPMGFSIYKYDTQFVRMLTQINYLSYVQLASSLLPHLELTNGSLVVISSVAGRMAGAFVAPYGGTKFALEGFFGSLQQELQVSKSNVTISILPYGAIDTDSAMSILDSKIRGVPFESSAKAGLAAVRVAVMRPTDHFWPWWGRIIVLIRNTAPRLFQAMRDNALNIEWLHDDIKKTRLAAANMRQLFYDKLE